MVVRFQLEPLPPHVQGEPRLSCWATSPGPVPLLEGRPGVTHRALGSTGAGSEMRSRQTQTRCPPKGTGCCEVREGLHRSDSPCRGPQHPRKTEDSGCVGECGGVWGRGGAGSLFLWRVSGLSPGTWGRVSVGVGPSFPDVPVGSWRRQGAVVPAIKPELGAAQSCWWRWPGWVWAHGGGGAESGFVLGAHENIQAQTA